MLNVKLKLKNFKLKTKIKKIVALHRVHSKLSERNRLAQNYIFYGNDVFGRNKYRFEKTVTHISG